MKPFRLLGVAAALVALVACSDDPGGPPAGTLPGFSFEDGMEGWTAHGIDLVVGGSEIEWSVAPSPDRASEGAQSLRLYMNNMTDAAKIWAERAIAVRPNRTYDVQVQFALASADYGDVNLFRVIAGAFESPPRTRQALTPAFRGDTGNGSGTDVGYQWQTRSYTTTVTSGPSGQLHVVVGIWGTWETARTYYIDDVRITASGR